MLRLEHYKQAAESLKCPLGAVIAVAKVESRGSGFLPTGEPKILFERHIFRRLLRQKGIYIPESDIHSSIPGGYLGGEKEHGRLKRAVEIDREAALQSASYGCYQIMGFHWNTLGYDSLQSFINAAYKDDASHLDMFVRFIKATPALHKALQRLDWTTVARLYNGPTYAKNKYDVKLAAEYNKAVKYGIA